MEKSELEILLDNEIQYAIENWLDWEKYKQVKDKKLLKNYIREQMLYKVYRFINDNIENEFEYYVENYKEVVKDEN